MKLYRKATEEEAAEGLVLPNRLLFPARDVEASPIPWCATDNAPMSPGRPDVCLVWIATEDDGDKGDLPCRLEEPQAVYRIKGTQ